jgi:hypothetical protein
VSPGNRYPSAFFASTVGHNASSWGIDHRPDKSALNASIKEQGKQRACACRDRYNGRRKRSQRDAPYREPQQPQTDEHAEHRQVIGTKESLRRNRCSGSDQPPPTARLEPPVERQQRHGHPVRSEELEVRKMGGAERRESKRAPRHEGAAMTARQREHEGVHRERGQRE